MDDKERQRMLKKLIFILKKRSLKYFERVHTSAHIDPRTGQLDSELEFKSKPEHYEQAAQTLFELAEKFNKEFGGDSTTHTIRTWLAVLTKEEL
jgi:hypothetical protein